MAIPTHPGVLRASPPRLGERGSAAIEFALVGPLFVVLLMGLVVYGGWFWMAQGVQHLAAEGARAAVAGLDAGERDRLARTAVIEGADGATILDPGHLSVAVADNAREIRVTVTYDATGEPILALAGLIPSPPTTIERAAAIRVGGY